VKLLGTLILDKINPESFFQTSNFKIAKNDVFNIYIKRVIIKILMPYQIYFYE